MQLYFESAETHNAMAFSTMMEGCLENAFEDFGGSSTQGVWHRFKMNCYCKRYMAFASVADVASNEFRFDFREFQYCWSVPGLVVANLPNCWESILGSSNTIGSS
jgi:hypothetical protein